MDREEIALLMAKDPPPAVLRPYRKQAGKRERERAEADMWTAIDRNDEQELARALAAGASPGRVRNGIPPVWYCAQAMQHGLVKRLMDAGADPSALAKSTSIWVAIAPRDNPEEAEKLAGLIGGTPRLDTAELARHGAWRLMAWAAGRHGHMQRKWGIRGTNGMGEGQMAWINAAVHGPEDIIQALSREWGVAGHCTVELAVGDGVARGAWEQVAIRDDVEKARRLLRHGWLPPTTGNNEKMANYRRPVSVLWRHGMGWVFLGKGAWNLWAWWMQSDARRREFNRGMELHPDQTLWEIARNKASLERLVALDISLDVRDRQGNTLAHGLFASPVLTKTLAAWWIEHRPGDLSVKNQQGLTPLEVHGEKKAALAWARQQWMGGRTATAASPVAAPSRF